MIIGRLTRDPELRTIPDGTPVAHLGMATNSVYTDKAGVKQQKVEYHDIVLWRRLAEIASQYVKKGAKIYIEGRLQTRSWDDPTGIKRHKTEIVGENMIMLDRPSGGGAQGDYEQGGAWQPRAGFTPSAPTTTRASQPFTPQGESIGSIGVPVAPRPKPPTIHEEELPTIDITEEMGGGASASKEEEEISIEDIPF